MRPRARLVVSAFVAVAAIACSTIPDLVFVADDAGTGAHDSGSDSPASLIPRDDGGGGGGGPDGGGGPRPDSGNVPPEGGAGDAGDGGGGCVRTGNEVCDDGLDNDCDQKIDCLDTQCTSFTCTDDAPSGFTYVLFADATRPACPTGYASADVKVLTGNGAHTCACKCSESGGTSCSTDTVTVMTGGSAGSCNTLVSYPNPNGACGGGGAALQAFAQITGPTGPASCAPSDLVTKDSPTDGRTCTPPSPGGGGCGGAQHCLGAVASGFQRCVAKAGADACPSAFPNMKKVGTSFSDQRTCSGCACAAPIPCDVKLEMYNHPNCNTGIDATLTTAAHGTCSATTATGVKTNKATITGGCTNPPTAPSTPDGGITVATGEQTVCCK